MPTHGKKRQQKQAAAAEPGLPVPDARNPVLRPDAGYRSVTQQIAQEMQRRILAGEWVEGSRLPPQRQLCDEIGVSRTALREATTTLEAQGYLSVEVGRGVFVTGRDRWPSAGQQPRERRYERAEIIQVRFFLEGWAAQFAAKRLGDSDLRRLATLVEAMDAALQRQDIAELDRLDAAFHAVIGAVSGNALLADLLAIVRSAYDRRERRPPQAGDRLKVISRRVKEHRSILAAFEARDPLAAKRAMQTHIHRLAARNQVSLPDEPIPAA